MYLQQIFGTLPKEGSTYAAHHHHIASPLQQGMQALSFIVEGI